MDKSVGEIGAICWKCTEDKKHEEQRKCTHFSTNQNAPKALAIAEENWCWTSDVLMQKAATFEGKIGRNCPSYFLAGISAGVAKPPPHLSQRTATPTAQGLLPLCTKGL